MIAKKTLIVGAVLMLLSVILGAIGSHAVKEIYPEYFHSYQTGVYYQTLHALAILWLGVLIHLKFIHWGKYILALFIIGILLFSGSLYLYTLSGGIKSFIHITPWGGFTFIVTWIIVIIDIAKGGMSA
ncbi:MAG: DUF423 domain-containing protein [Bdellovibrionales bacterium]|nr:DUF423 domain-containing protein [Bdellovibrionales bacterium]